TSRLEDPGRERLEMERNRNIHTYIGHSFSIARLREAIAFLRDFAHFEPEALMIDGYDFAAATLEGVAELRQIARELNAEIWMTAVTHRDAPKDEHGIPEPVSHVQEAISVIVSLAHDGKAVRIRLLKDHESTDVSDLSIALNPTTMLLMQE
ncbi:MAG TPA: hypothetical protein VFG76_12230, partial [Candidatus Polarisedimenticolia bacterium]|nr:hypothetical protein [Candidatus Polarisedimenticolia bacterium]